MLKLNKNLISLESIHAKNLISLESIHAKRSISLRKNKC
jgi:hypothetical protein